MCCTRVHSFAKASVMPHYVHHGWNNVDNSHLYNATGLPTSRFTSEPNPVH